ncbi:MAG: hypothetical protein ACUVQP_08530 [Bacteroidales bacterium]
MNKVDFIPAKDWDIVVLKSIEYSVNPYLIAAIGWHETHWGRLGWGRKGYYLGVGCFSEDNADPSWQGLNRQLDFACPALSNFTLFLPNFNVLLNFAEKVWRPGNPTVWAKAVHSYYVQYLDLFGKDMYSYSPIPEVFRGVMAKLYSKKLINTPYGDLTFYRLMYFIYMNILSKSS